jgi:hypothetical protein
MKWIFRQTVIDRRVLKGNFQNGVCGKVPNSLPGKIDFTIIMQAFDLFLVCF